MPAKGKLPFSILIIILDIFLGKYSATIILLVPKPYVAIPEKKNIKSKCHGPTANNVLICKINDIIWIIWKIVLRPYLSGIGANKIEPIKLPKKIVYLKLEQKILLNNINQKHIQNYLHYYFCL